MRQIPLFENSTPLVHGGALASGKRKSRRPLCSKRPLHCVLKAKQNNLFKNAAWIEKETQRLAAKFHLTIYGLAINFDHIHLALRIPGRRAYAAFMRALTGLLAWKFGKNLWSLLPFTRVLAWGRDFRQVLTYLKKNREEAAGTRPHEKRKDWYGRQKKKPEKKAQGP